MKLHITNNSGMTLLEIIIAIAILGIMSIGLLSMFTTSFKFIANAGNRSIATYDAKSLVESALNQKNTDSLAPGITIKFHDNSTITAPGKVLQKTHTENGATSDVYLFQPTY